MRLKTHRLLGFCMLFQFTLTKFSKSELFSCLQKVDHVTNYCKRPISLGPISSSMEKRTVDRCLACEGGIVKTTRACWIWNDYSQLIFNAHSWNYKGALASTTATAAKPSVLKWTPVSQEPITRVSSILVSFIPICWKWQVWANFTGVDSWGPHSSLERKKEIRRRLFTSSIKLAIRHFHFVVVQGR